MALDRDAEGKALAKDKDFGEGAEDLSGHPEEEVDADADPHVQRQLDKGLKETFPASDPVSINPGAD